MKHFVCKKCGNLVAMINDSGIRIHCCGEKTEEVTPSVSDPGREKHTPYISVKNGDVFVKVGSEENAHPMGKDHSISWICLVTTEGSQRKILSPEGKAEAHFALTPNEKVIKAFAYCNLHGLWVSECKEHK